MSRRRDPANTVTVSTHDSARTYQNRYGAADATAWALFAPRGERELGALGTKTGRVATRQVVYRPAPSGDCHADFVIASMMRLVSLGSTSITVGTSAVM